MPAKLGAQDIPAWRANDQTMESRHAANRLRVPHAAPYDVLSRPFSDSNQGQVRADAVWKATASIRTVLLPAFVPWNVIVCGPAPTVKEMPNCAYFMSLGSIVPIGV